MNPAKARALEDAEGAPLKEFDRIQKK